MAGCAHFLFFDIAVHTYRTYIIRPYYRMYYHTGIFICTWYDRTALHKFFVLSLTVPLASDSRIRKNVPLFACLLLVRRKYFTNQEYNFTGY